MILSLVATPRMAGLGGEMRYDGARALAGEEAGGREEGADDGPGRPLPVALDEL